MVVLGGGAVPYERYLHDPFVALNLPVVPSSPPPLFSLSIVFSPPVSLSLSLSLSISISLSLARSLTLSLSLALTPCNRVVPCHFRSKLPTTTPQHYLKYLLSTNGQSPCSSGKPSSPEAELQGYLAHKKSPSPLGPP